MNITVIGGGNMGLTYALSIHKNYKNTSISILEKDEKKIEELKFTTSFFVSKEASRCIPNADIILLAVKPQIIEIVFNEVKEFVNTNQLIISIMAGVTIQSIFKGLNTPKIVRAMPNLPAQIGLGVTGYMVSKNIATNELKKVETILSATGKAIQVYKEDDIDAITSLSGSGPAYVFYFMNAMIEQAKTLGFSEKEAKKIVTHTFLGTANLFESSNDNAQIWIDRVTSKGGTTHAAITSFKENNIENSIKAGVKAAFNRAKELAEN